MSKVIVDISMSLDGFIAGPDDAMDWAYDAEPEAPDSAPRADPASQRTSGWPP